MYPTTNGGMQNESSVGIHTYFCTCGTDLYAHSVLSNIISASEISRLLGTWTHRMSVISMAVGREPLSCLFHSSLRSCSQTVQELPGNNATKN